MKVLTREEYAQIKILEKIKAIIRYNGLYNEQIEDLIDKEISELKEINNVQRN